MKIYNRVALTIAVTLSLLFTWSCSDNEPGGQKINYGELRIDRMDLSGAVSIVHKSNNSSRAIDGEYLSAGLYKVDAAGNISAVAVYFSTDNNGNRLEHEEALCVVPKRLFDLTDNYMLVVECVYYDSDGDFVSNKTEYDENDEPIYIRQEVPYKDLLVRKSDGKIWCVDNISEHLYDRYYNQLNGHFKEDSRGNLYQGYDNDIFRFNFQESTPSYEQLTANIRMYPDFFIAPNGVVWSYSSNTPSFDELHLGWPHSGFQILSPESIKADIADTLKRSIPDGFFTDKSVSRAYDVLIGSQPDVFYVNHNDNPLVIFSNETEYWHDSGFYYTLPLAEEDNQKLVNFLEESEWPFGLVYDVIIGDSPGSARLSNNPISLVKAPSDERLSDVLNKYNNGLRIQWIYKTDSYILTYSMGGWITKIDLEKREWTWLTKLESEFELDFDEALEYNGKVWCISYPNKKNGFGAYWLDLKTFESGFVRFNIDLTPYANISYGGLYRIINGKVFIQAIDPATSNQITIYIDIATGETSTETQAPEMIFETIINLN